jgi:predicted DCC family thiol-disulfide oxidoreductase YuxK
MSTASAERGWILYDDACPLCRFLIDRLPRRAARAFRAVPHESETARLLRAACGLQNDAIAVVIRGRAYTQSAALLAIARELGGVWQLVGMLRRVPSRWLDAAYQAVARRRLALSRVIAPRACRRCGPARSPTPPPPHTPSPTPIEN